MDKCRMDDLLGWAWLRSGGGATAPLLLLGGGGGFGYGLFGG